MVVRGTVTRALVFGALLSGILVLPASATTLPLPASMAAVGDSITQAASTGGSLGADAPQNSWSTGTSSTVQSHYLRLLAAGAPISGANHNLSVSGAKMDGLLSQMERAAALAPDYLTVLIGGNDLCTDTVGSMTLVEDFRDQFKSAMGALAASPDTNVLVVSIPDVHQLWELFRGSFFARFVWSSAGICQSLLANPTSTKTADVERRREVRERNIAYNAVLAEVCAAHARCRFDGNAVFNTRLERTDVSGDYFHPSVQGQSRLAAVSWSAGYAFGASPAPNIGPTASFSWTCSELLCEFSDHSTDADGSIVARSWDFGDGQAATEPQPTHEYGSVGTYTVTLLVTDDDGATATLGQSVSVEQSAPPEPSGTMHLAELSGTTTGARNTWSAQVTITVIDGGGAPVQGASVSGTWSFGSSATCLTAGDGSCTIASGTLNKKTASVTFETSAVLRDGFTHDGVQRSITLTKP